MKWRVRINDGEKILFDQQLEYGHVDFIQSDDPQFTDAQMGVSVEGSEILVVQSREGFVREVEEDDGDWLMVKLIPKTVIRGMN